jgi:hypothetical protein
MTDESTAQAVAVSEQWLDHDQAAALFRWRLGASIGRAEKELNNALDSEEVRVRVYLSLDYWPKDENGDPAREIYFMTNPKLQHLIKNTDRFRLCRREVHYSEDDLLDWLSRRVGLVAVGIRPGDNGASAKRQLVPAPEDVIDRLISEQYAVDPLNENEICKPVREAAAALGFYAKYDQIKLAVNQPKFKEQRRRRGEKRK